MPRYTFTSAVNTTLNVNGGTVRLRANQPYGTDDPCQITSVVLAWQAKMQATGANPNFSENQEGVFNSALQDCIGQAFAGLDQVLAPDSLAAGAPPDAAAQDGPPPDGNDDAGSSGAPNPQPNADVTAEGPRTDDPSLTPGQRMHDRQDPANEEQIASEAADQGLAPNQIASQVENARRNEAADGERHPDFSRNDRQSLDATADPVSIFSGQFTLDLVDVEIASPGMPLRLERVYRSGNVYFGPWGFQWDHNYNVYLRPLTSGDVAVWTGRIREDVYTPTAAGGFEPPFGVFRKLEYQAASPGFNERWTLRERGGRSFMFERPAGWPQPDRVPLVLIEDRNGNRHALSYDPLGRLDLVDDGMGRFIQFTYGDCGLLEQVSDHIGRRWQYLHHPEIEHLIKVVAPPTDEFPQGRSTQYEYDEANPHPQLRHNLIAIVDPDGQIVVENTYENDPSSDDFGRIVQQEFEGEMALFSAERLQYSPRTPAAINTPALRVTVIDPGVWFIYTFNSRGDLLDKRFRLCRDGSYRIVPETFRYDQQGNLTEHYLADGRGMLYEYDAANVDPRARGNLLTAVQLASPVKPAVSIEVLRATYEPMLWQLKSWRDPEGSITTLIYDYEIAPGGRGDVKEIRRPPCNQPDGTVLTAIERFDYNARGQMMRHEQNGAVHEFFYSAAGADQGYLIRRTTTKSAQTTSESYERDAVGNLRAKIDGAGGRSEYEVDANGLLRRKRLADGTEWRFNYDGGGRLRRILEPRGDYDDAVLAGSPIEHEFAYTPTGMLKQEVYAANTLEPRSFSYRRNAEGQILEIRDPLGRRFTRDLDERGLVLKENAYDPVGTPLQSRNFVYERTGELRRVTVTGGPAVQLDWDGFGRLRELTDPGGTRIQYQRNRRAQPVQIDIVGRIGAPGTPDGLLARQRLEYNEEGSLRRRIDVLFENPLGPFQDLATEFWRDEAQLLAKLRNPNGLEERFTYTGNGAPATQEDSEGNRIRWAYDGAGRLQTIESTEVGVGGALSFFTERQSHDAVGRVLSETDPLGNLVGYEYDARGMLRLARNPGGNIIRFTYNAHRDLIRQDFGGVSLRWNRDARGFATTLVDPTGSGTSLEYDALNRLKRVVRPDGAEQRYSYEIGGGLAEFQDYDGTRVQYTNSLTGLPEELRPLPAAGVAATNPLRYSYDGLRRLVRAEDGTGIVTRTYDSLQRLLRETANGHVNVEHEPTGLWRRITYPDGRRDVQQFDRLGRQIGIRFELAGTLPLPAHGIAVGSMVAQLQWAGKHRPGTISTVGGVNATLTYDGAARLSELRWNLPGAVVCRQIFFRDGLGLVRAETRQNGPVGSCILNLDALKRLSAVKFDVPLGSLPPSSVGMSQAALDAAIQNAFLQPASRTSSFLWTPGDAPASQTDVDGGGAMVGVHNYATNALNQIVTVDGTPLTWDMRGNLLTYGARSFRYDAYRRLVEVNGAAGGPVRLLYDALGRVRKRTIAGSTREYSYLGNELLQERTAGGVVAQYGLGPRPDQPLTAHFPGGSYGLVADAAGSLVACVDTAGNLVERYRYGIFGTPEILTANGLAVRAGSVLGIEPRFHGRPWVAAAGLYDFRTRFLDPSLMGFIQPDPFAFSGSWNFYAYARYNPFNFTDPDGLWITILAGAIIGAAIGGIGTALSGGDVWDCLAAAGAGAIGGALFGAGMPIAGAAIAGGLMGAWSGGRIGYRQGGVQGAVGGALIGGAVGAGIGVVTGYASAGVGNAVGTAVYGRVFNYALSREASAATAALTARASSMIAGGYTGGATAGILGNTASTLAVDVATGQAPTAQQFEDGLVHGLTVDGALGAVGASADRFAQLGAVRLATNRSWSTRPGYAQNIGLEGESLVGRAVGREPARQSEAVTIGGRTRYPDFPSSETIPQENVVIEVKNKVRLSTSGRRSDVAQIQDFANLAARTGGRVLLYHRPGMDVTPVAGISNVVTIPIPQQPLVVPIPHAFPAQSGSGENGPK